MPTHLIATNRAGFNLQGENKDQLNLLPEFVFGEITFDPSDEDGKNDSFCDYGANNSSYVGCLNVNEKSLGSYARFFRKLYELTKSESGEEVLIFLHGYRHPIDRLKITVRRLQSAYVDDPNCNIQHLVMISWPSTAETDEYSEDRERAKGTGQGALFSFLKEWKKFLKEAMTPQQRKVLVSRVNLIAASMGNKVLEETSKCFAKFNCKLFHEVIHTAPDVGRAQFNKDKPLANFSNFAERVHVYYNPGDLILMLSSLFENKLEDRLGLNGPRFWHVLPDNTTFVNVRWPVAMCLMNPTLILPPMEELQFPISHTYFVKVKRVVGDAKSILKHEKNIKGRKWFFSHRWLLLP